MAVERGPMPKEVAMSRSLRAEVMAAVWGGSVPENAANILRVQIHKLRRKLPAHMKVLNVYGVGYMIEVKE